MRSMRLRTAFSTTIIITAGLSLLGFAAGCGGSGGGSGASSNIIAVNGRYTSVQVSSPVSLMDPYPIGLGLNNTGDAVLGTERGGAVATRDARPRSLHPFPPMVPYYLWQSSSLTTLPAGYDFGEINDSGAIVGTSSAGVAVTYSAGAVTPLSIPDGYTQTDAEAINSAGDVAGIATTGSNAVQAFMWKGGAATSLGLPAGITEATCTGINASDQIIGEYLDSQNEIHSFLWSQGTLTALGSFAPAAINASGEIAGATGLNQPAVWISGTLTALPLPSQASGAALGFPVAINDSGEVVGYVSASRASFPALWNAGKLYNLASAASTSSTSQEIIYDVYAINNGGQILAAAAIPSGDIVVLLTPKTD